jgi:hypothetical protein
MVALAAPSVWRLLTYDRMSSLVMSMARIPPNHMWTPPARNSETASLAVKDNGWTRQVRVNQPLMVARTEQPSQPFKREAEITKE